MVLMKFGWDPAKSSKNARERGLPFSIAMALFDGDTIEFDGRRKDYGERRIVVYGAVAGRVMACVCTWRGEPDDPIRWIVSLRKAKQEEVDGYRAAFPE
jgi:uncharacterized DUF497 family protein